MQGISVTGSAYCQAHDPTLAAERAAWRRAGGLARTVPEGKPAELSTVEDVRRGLAATIGSTWRQANTPERSRALCSLYLATLRTFELGELTDRVEEIEAELERDNGHSRPYRLG
ncbi:MAG: hypothetical protein ACRDHG_01780 [Anaerolineales bacterium]